MSDEVAKTVAKKANSIVSAMKNCGCQLNNAIMQHSLLALAVIPEIRISDLGIIDVNKFQHVDLFV
jgi:adenine deaminase